MTVYAAEQCHLCRAYLGEEYVMVSGLLWCSDLIECKFRARRRLGMSLPRCVRAKGQDLLHAGDRELQRAAAIQAAPLRPRNPDYEDHIASSWWEDFSGDQKLMAKFRCEKCRQPAQDLHAHHLDYRTLGKERPHDVVVVCPLCHRELDEARRAKRHPRVTVVVKGFPPLRVVEWARA